ncbi:MAG: hypothetical protein HQL45_00990 [Alphaproteobacteria bacterium]|nr:hypothetical protein [Alphaproteobacteria bacterium]
MIRSWSWLERAAFLTAGLCLALMAIRTGSAMSFTEPLHVVTSGTEHGPLFTIWKSMTGASITTDRHDIPYDSTVYNWLFYRLYGLFCGLILAAFGLQDEWMPTFARLLTLLALPLTVLAARAAFLRMQDGQDGDSGRPATILAVFLAAGPLIGFWAVTARPDLWAMLIEILAVVCYWRLESASRAKAVLAFAALALLAWSMKQTNIFSLAGMGLYLLVRLRWRDLFLLSGLSAAGWGATLSLGGPEFVKNLLFVGIPFNFQVMHPFLVLKGALLKTLPILTLLGAGLLLALRSAPDRPKLFSDERLVFALCGLGASFLLAFATSVQEGSAENYYFIPAFFAALAGVRLLACLGGASPLWVRGLQGLGWAAMSLALLMIFAGRAGTMSVRHQHQAFVAQRQCLQGLTPPYFVKDDYLSLPWMSRPNPPFPLSYSYFDERRVQHPFQQGGIGGLIGEGFFTTLAFVTDDPPEMLDGTPLSGYTRRPGSCAGMVFMDRAAGADQ